MHKSKGSKSSGSLTTFSAVNTTLSNQEIKYLYELLFYLSDLQKNGKINGFDIRNKNLKEFLKSACVKLDYTMPPAPHYDKNKIVFFAASSVCYSLLKHIRNAFAHGGLIKEKTAFVIEDKYRGMITAYGRINHKLLFLLIDKIVSTKK